MIIKKSEKKIKSSDHSSKKLMIYIGVFIGLLLCTSTCYFIKINLEKNNKIYYQEKGIVDYKIFLNENDFYDTPYLEKDKIKVFVGSLIDKIDITFDYDFKVNDDISLNFNYDIIGKIVIKDESEENTYFEKEYPLLTDQEFRLENSDYYKLRETVSIDYNHYNELAKNFSSTYGVNANSSLQVYLKIKATSENINLLKENLENVIQITIPLSKKSVEIKIDDKEINNVNQLMEKSDIGLLLKVIFTLILIFAIVTIIVLIKIIYILCNLNNKKSKYDKYIQKLLIQYDRVIAETTYFPDKLKYNIIQLTKFEELLDVRDNLKLPIMYYCIEEHEKCHFYIKTDKDLYLVTIENEEKSE